MAKCCRYCYAENKHPVSGLFVPIVWVLEKNLNMAKAKRMTLILEQPFFMIGLIGRINLTFLFFIGKRVSCFKLALYVL